MGVTLLTTGAGFLAGSGGKPAKVGRSPSDEAERGRVREEGAARQGHQALVSVLLTWGTLDPPWDIW